MKAVRIVPLLGEVYTHYSGGEYRCVERREKEPGDLWHKARLRRLDDGWTFWAHDIRQNEDGTIFWSFSTGGIFIKDPMGVE